MVASSLLDLVMIRYNAAHRGAERDVFPVTQPLDLPVIAYTALRWGALLRSTPDDPPGFAVPRPPEWYRFVLQNPAVAVTLAAPRTRAELDEDLLVLDASGPLGDAEYAALADHGARPASRRQLPMIPVPAFSNGESLFSGLQWIGAESMMQLPPATVGANVRDCVNPTALCWLDAPFEGDKSVVILVVNECEESSRDSDLSHNVPPCALR